LTPIGTDINAHFCPFGLQSSPLAAEGALVFGKACELGLEGIVSKRQGSFYKSGKSRNWLKTVNPNFVRI
jgi:ATP-dependent DNA ligase